MLTRPEGPRPRPEPSRPRLSSRSWRPHKPHKVEQGLWRWDVFRWVECTLYPVEWLYFAFLTDAYMILIYNSKCRVLILLLNKSIQSMYYSSSRPRSGPSRPRPGSSEAWTLEATISGLEAEARPRSRPNIPGRNRNTWKNEWNESSGFVARVGSSQGYVEGLHMGKC